MHAEELRRYLSEATGRPIALKMNSNTHSMITTRRDGTGRGLKVSLHRMFLTADEATITALARFIVGPTPQARESIRLFISSHREDITRAALNSVPRRVRGTAAGTHHHLRMVAHAINHHYFAGNLDFRIIWGREGHSTKRRQRHLTLGTWNDRQRIIRIHPILDHPHVPDYFVAFVVYHEMLHIALPSTVSEGGRMSHHPPEFYSAERKFEEYARASRWERRWLPILIDEWNGGAKLPPEAAVPDLFE